MAEAGQYESCPKKSGKQSPYQIILKHGVPEYLELKLDTHSEENEDAGDYLEPISGARAQEHDTDDYLRPLCSTANQEDSDLRSTRQEDAEDYLRPTSQNDMDDYLRPTGQEDSDDYLRHTSQEDADDYLRPTSQEDADDYLYPRGEKMNQEDAGDYLHPPGSTMHQITPGNRSLTPLPPLPEEATAANYDEIELEDFYEEVPDIRGEPSNSTVMNNSQDGKAKSKGKRNRVFVIVGVMIGTIALLSSVVLLVYFFPSRNTEPVHEPPRIEIHPKATTVIPLGGSALFECRVIGGVPPPETSWARANNVPFKANTLEDRQGNLRFITVTGDEQGTYICLASNVAGSVTATATLIIRGDEPPRIEIYPEATTVIPPGGSALFQCRVTGGVPPPEMSWARANNEQFTVNTVHEGRGYLRFMSVTGDEQGTYICTASNVAGSVTATATLIIQEIPTQQPTATMVSDRTTILQGTTGTLYCIVTGSPAPNITWSKVNAELGSNHQVEGSVLRILEAEPEDSGSYICRADNIAGGAQDSAVVEVERHEPPRIEIYPNETTVIPSGGSALFECRVIGGVPPPETSWARAHNEQFTANTLEDRQGNLRFISVTGDEHGIYICTASNVAGSVTATATLRIQGVPDYSQVSHVKDYTNRGSGQYQLKTPSGIAVTQNDHIWICDYNNEKILVLDNQLQPVSEIRADGGPFDATVSSGLIYITMNHIDQIHVYNENRTLLSVVGSKGSGLGQFRYPRGITSVDNKVYICDYGNKRIQVYENGTWSQFGQGEFGRGPRYIAVSSNHSRLAVVDYDDNLYILNRSHHVTHKFNKKQPPLNIDPRGVTFDLENNLIICDRVGGSLVVLDQDYNIITRFGGQVFSFPYAVAWTRSGNLLVTDADQDAVHLFRVPYRSRP